MKLPACSTGAARRREDVRPFNQQRIGNAAGPHNASSGGDAERSVDHRQAARRRTHRLRSRSGLAFGLIALMFAAVPAPAQLEVPTGSRLTSPKPADIPDGNMPEVDRVRKVMVEFGECVARTDPGGSARTVALFPTDPIELKALQRVATGDCLRMGELQMSASIMRGALFIGLYRRDYRQVPPPAPPPEKLDFTVGAADPQQEEARGAIMLRLFIDCVVREDPADARITILAPVASRAETAAYAALAPHLGRCLPAGQQVTFSKTILSGLIAEVAYRNAVLASSDKADR